MKTAKQTKLIKLGETESKIIRAFVSLIDNEKEVPVEKILQKSGVSRPTFYSYFKSLTAIYKRIEDIVVEYYLQLIDTDIKTFVTNISDYQKGIAKLIKDNGDFVKHLSKSNRVGDLVEGIAVELANRISTSHQMKEYYQKYTYSYEGVLSDGLDAYSVASATLNAGLVLMRRDININEDFLVAWCSNFNYKIVVDSGRKAGLKVPEKNYLDDFYKKHKK